jgi:16S rRNA (guanine527-N7)-methyltransferase
MEQERQTRITRARKDNVQELIAGAQKLQITLRPEHLEAFCYFQEELIAWNERFNLTAITDDTGIQIRHYLDSLSCLLALQAGERFGSRQIIDVGTGAGFPGIPLKIVCPSIKLTLLEATGKKVRFLQHIVDQLHLEDVTVIHGRAEELGQDPRYRERYDWAVARAVADLPILVEYLLPLVRVGGRALAQKGEGAPAEVQRSEWALKQLGGQIRRLIPVDLRGLSETRYLVVLDKVAATPAKYPRRPGMPSKRPLLEE